MLQGCATAELVEPIDHGFKAASAFFGAGHHDTSSGGERHGSSDRSVWRRASQEPLSGHGVPDQVQNLHPHTLVFPWDCAFVGRGRMNADFRVRPVGAAERDLLIGMYDRFDSLGGALGLPPHTAEARRQWIGDALRHEVNVAAFSASGEVAGHCFMVAGKARSAELAIFVHQDSRRRGFGAALVKAALEWGSAAGLRRVWAMTSSENKAALQLLKSCGFRLTSFFPTAELEIDLPVWCGNGLKNRFPESRPDGPRARL